MLSSVPGFADQMAWLSGRLLSDWIIRAGAANHCTLLCPARHPTYQSGLFSGLVPLLESCLSAGLMDLDQTAATPAEGFVHGLICGGIFALMESLMAASAGSGEFLRDLAVARWEPVYYIWRPAAWWEQPWHTPGKTENIYDWLLLMPSVFFAWPVELFRGAHGFGFSCPA